MRDLTNQCFGRLTAMEPIQKEGRRGVIWKCKCSCGGSKDVPASYLLNGHTKSCGCINLENRMKQDITGKRWGRLVALQFMYVENNKSHWLFQCDCGKQKVIAASDVKHSGTRSCGCLANEHAARLNRQDITGERFDRLKAICPTEERDEAGSVVWKCICQCGNEVEYSVNQLRSGRIHSCGCLYQETRKICYKMRQDLQEHTSVSALIASKKPNRNNTSGYTGVYLEKKTGRWQAYINLQKRRYYLGSYEDIATAVSIRAHAEKHFHDPIIVEHFEKMNSGKKTQFMEYLNKLEEDKRKK